MILAADAYLRNYPAAAAAAGGDRVLLLPEGHAAAAAAAASGSWGVAVGDYLVGVPPREIA
jgi:hypothetical protein